MIKFQCPHCDKHLGAGSDYAGKTVKCKRCQQPITVPLHANEARPKAAGSEVIKFRCGQCDQKIAIPAKYAGRRVKCPGCKAAVTAPAAGGGQMAESFSGSATANVGGSFSQLSELEQQPDAFASELAAFTQDALKPLGGDRLDVGDLEDQAKEQLRKKAQKEARKKARAIHPEVKKTIFDAMTQGPGKLGIALALGLAMGAGAVAAWFAVAWAMGPSFLWLTNPLVMLFVPLGAVGVVLPLKNRNPFLGLICLGLGVVIVFSGKVLIGKYIMMPRVREMVQEQIDHNYRTMRSKDLVWQASDRDEMFAPIALEMVELGYYDKATAWKMISLHTDLMIAEQAAAAIEEGEMEGEVPEVEIPPMYQKDYDLTIEMLDEAMTEWLPEERAKVMRIHQKEIAMKYSDDMLGDNPAGDTVSVVSALSCFDILFIPLSLICAFKIGASHIAGG